MPGSVGHLYLDVKLQTQGLEAELKRIAQMWDKASAGPTAATSKAQTNAAKAAVQQQTQAQKILQQQRNAAHVAALREDAQRTASAQKAAAAQAAAAQKAAAAQTKAQQQAAAAQMTALQQQIRATSAAAQQQVKAAQQAANAGQRAATQTAAVVTKSYAQQAAAAQKAAAAQTKAAQQAAAAQAKAAAAQGSVGGALTSGSQELFVGLGAARSGNVFYGLAAGARYVKNLTAALGEASIASKVLIAGVAGVGIAVAAVGAAVGIAAVKFAMFGAEQAANMEMLSIQLEGLLGSAGRAKEEMSFLLQLGKESIVPTQSLIEADRQLLAFGVTADDTRQSLVQFFSDFGTATGASEQQVYYLSLALGQVAAIGKANSVDMRQLANAGINTMQVYEIIGKNIGKTAQEVAAGVSEGLVTADALYAALAEYGVGFAATAEKARLSTQGLMSNIRDTFTTDIALAFDKVNAKVSEFLQSVLKVVQTIDFAPFAAAVGDALGALTGAVGGGTTAANAFKTLIEVQLPAAVRILGAAIAAVVTPIRLMVQAFQTAWTAITAVIDTVVRIKPLLYGLVTVTGLYILGLIAQNGAMILANAEMVIYGSRVIIVSAAQGVAAGATTAFAAALGTLRAALAAVLGPIGVIITALGLTAVAANKAWDASEKLANGEQSLSDSMKENVGVIGVMTLTLAGARKAMDALTGGTQDNKGATEGAADAQEREKNVLSGTVSSAIAAGEAMGTVAYYAAKRGMTSGTVTSAYQQGASQGRPIPPIVPVGPAEPKKVGGGGGGGSSSGLSKGEQAALDRAKLWLEQYGKLYSDANAARKKFTELVAEPFGQPSEITKAMGSGSIDTIIGMNQTLREQLMAFYRPLIQSNALGKKAMQAAKDARDTALAQLDDDTRVLIEKAKRKAQILEEDLPRIQKEYEDAVAGVRGNLDFLDSWKQQRDIDVVKPWDDMLATANKALEVATARYEEANSKLQDLISERDSFLNSVQDSLRSFVNNLTTIETEIQKYTRLDAVGSFLIENQKQTESFQQTLAQRLQALKDWTANVRSLMARGLDESLVRQFVSAGVDGSGSVVAQLAGADDATLTGINQIQSDLMTEVNAFKADTSAAWFDAGIAGQQAYVDSLSGTVSAVQAQIADLQAGRQVALDIVQTYYDGQKAIYDQQLVDLKANYEAQRKSLEDEVKLIDDAAATTTANINSRFAGLAVDTAAQGINVIDGLIMGMNGKEEQAVQNAARIARRINRELAGVFGIASPSKVTTYMGQMLGQGLIVGMNQMNPKVGIAAQKMAVRSLPAPSLRSVGLPGSSAITGANLSGAGFDGASAGGAMTVKVYIGETELTDIVDTRIEASDGRSLDYVASGRRF